MYKTKTAYSIYILLLFHIVGVVGLSIDAGDSFAKLTPLNLLLITTTIFFNLRETLHVIKTASADDGDFSFWFSDFRMRGQRGSSL